MLEDILTNDQIDHIIDLHRVRFDDKRCTDTEREILIEFLKDLPLRNEKWNQKIYELEMDFEPVLG